MSEQTKTAWTWLTEFGPEWNVPAELLDDERFTDVSWGHDTCPSFTFKGQDGTLRLFVDHPDITKRELGERPRFTVHDDDTNASFETDDVNEAIAKFAELAEFRKARQP